MKIDEKLQDAARNGQADGVANQLNSGANVNSATSCYRTTPLHWACIYGHVKVVQVLLDNDVDLEFPNKDGMQALHFACRESHYRIAELLLDHGAAVNAQDIFGFTALHYASKSGSNRCVFLLLSRDADTNIQTRIGKIPIDMAQTNEIINLFYNYPDIDG